MPLVLLEDPLVTPARLSNEVLKSPDVALLLERHRLDALAVGGTQQSPEVGDSVFLQSRLTKQTSVAIGERHQISQNRFEDGRLHGFPLPPKTYINPQDTRQKRALNRQKCCVVKLGRVSKAVSPPV